MAQYRFYTADVFADRAPIRAGIFTIDRARLGTRRSLLHIEIDKRCDRPAVLRVGCDTLLATPGILTLDS